MRDHRSFIDEETRDASCGPLLIDCDLARLHGWSEKQINRAFELVSVIARKEAGIVQRTKPELFRKRDGVSVFVGRKKKTKNPRHCRHPDCAVQYRRRTKSYRCEYCHKRWGKDPRGYPWT